MDIYNLPQLPNVSDHHVPTLPRAYSLSPTLTYIVLGLSILGILCWCVQDYRFFLSLGRGGRKYELSEPLYTTGPDDICCPADLADVLLQLNTIYSAGSRFTSSLDPLLSPMQTRPGLATIRMKEAIKRFWHSQIERDAGLLSGALLLNGNSANVHDQT
jgi:hypothetical protein